jgi:hypothetical protein
MPAITVKPLILKDCLLTIGASDYQASVSSAKFTPSGGIQVWKGLTPTSVHTSADTPTWTLDLKYVQDWETAGSLSNYLFAHEGETVACTFEPKAGGATVTANITITSGGIGGDVDAWGEETVSLGSDRPVIGL